jgi:hypothetical protein
MEGRLVPLPTEMSIASVPLSLLRVGELCAVCASPAATRVPPPIAHDASLRDLADDVPPIPLCAECADRHSRAVRRPLYARRASVLAPGILTGLVSAFVSLNSPLLAVLVFVAITSIWAVVLRASRRARSARLPVLVCGGRGGFVELRLNRFGPKRRPVAAGEAYRSPSPMAPRSTEAAATSFLRVRDDISGVFFAAGTFASAIIAGVAWNGLYVDVHCEYKGTGRAKLILDNDDIPVAPGAITRYVRSGTRVFGVECPDTGARHLFRADLSADDRVYIDVQFVCDGGSPDVKRTLGGGIASPFRGI